MLLPYIATPPPCTPMSVHPSGETARAAAWSSRSATPTGTAARWTSRVRKSALRRRQDARESHSFEGAPLQLPTPQHRGRPLLFELQNPVLPPIPFPPPPPFPQFACANLLNLMRNHARQLKGLGWEREGRAACGKRPQFPGKWRPPSMHSAWWHRR